MIKINLSVIQINYQKLHTVSLDQVPLHVSSIKCPEISFDSKRWQNPEPCFVVELWISDPKSWLVHTQSNVTTDSLQVLR